MQSTIDSTTSEALLLKAAGLVRQHRLEVPAIFLLELVKPMVSVFYNLQVLASPVATIAGGQGLLRELMVLMQSRENVEKLICLIEAGEPKPQALSEPA